MTCARFARHAAAILALLASMTQPALAEQWLVISGASHHFRQSERDWRQFNPGIGIERALERPGLYAVGGYFRNSYDRHALYAGVRWMPFEWGSLKLGGYALASTGYPSPILLLPGLSVEGERLGLNIVLAPNLGRYSGYVGMQVRVRMID